MKYQSVFSLLPFRIWKPIHPMPGSYGDMSPHLQLPDPYMWWSEPGEERCARMFLELTDWERSDFFDEGCSIHPALAAKRGEIEELWMARARFVIQQRAG